MFNTKSFIYILIIGLLAFGTQLYLSKDEPVPTIPVTYWGLGDPKQKEDTSIRPFKISISKNVIDDLYKRLENTRFGSPGLEGVGFNYGFRSEALEKIVKFWKDEYNWSEREVFLNKYPQFKTKIQGLDIHFIHAKPSPEASKTHKVVPIMLLHGWPGSVREFYSLIERLTVPKSKDDVLFEVIAPSLPGYGFSSGTSKPGLGVVQMAQILRGVMLRVGHKQWYLQGGDWGSQVASIMALLYPQNILGLHINMCAAMGMKAQLYMAVASIYPSLFMGEKFVEKNYPFWEKFKGKIIESGYLHIQATKPDTVGAALADSPAGLAAYILEKFSTGTNLKYRDLEDGGLTRKFTYTDLLDNVMIYWVTNSMTTAMRLYSEYFSEGNRALGIYNMPIDTPTWCARFPGEIYYQPDCILRMRYRKLVGASDIPQGGHFAALEMPERLAQDIRMAVDKIQKTKQ